MVTPFDVIPWVFLASIVAFLFWISVGRHRRWASFAEALGFRDPLAGQKRGFFQDVAPLQGAHGAWTVQVRAYAIGQGKGRASYTAVEMPLPQADPGFTMRVRRRGFGTRIEKALGSGDVAVGNPEFDGVFHVESPDAARARAALGLQGQQGLLGLAKHHELTVEPARPDAAGSHVPVGVAPSSGASLSLGGSRRSPESEVALLRLVWSGTVTDAARVHAALPALAMLAASVTSAAPRPGR